MDENEERDATPETEGEILSVHFGRSANCSSIGSYIDYLFLSATASGALLAGLAVALSQRAKSASQPSTPEEEPSAQAGPSGEDPESAEEPRDG